MTPEKLSAIEAYLEDGRALDAVPASSLVDEIRRLWAERDARQVVGGPVSETALETARNSCNESWFMYANFAPKLVAHITFLERLLLDGDDLLAVRRTGYADGWRAGVEAATELVKDMPLLTKVSREIIAREVSRMGKEGPP
jgi:hypothetical protein